MTTRRVGAAVLCGIVLSGCAVGGGRMNIAADRRFEQSALDAVHVGMSEAAVIAALGLPAAFGVDDRGRRYLHYSLHSLGAHLFATGTGPIGVNATLIRSAATGFEARLYFDRGRVTRVATHAYLEEGHPAAEAGEGAGAPEASR